MLALGSDHGGYILKEKIKKHLDKKNIPYRDFGAHSEENCDYPQMAAAPCNAVLSGECTAALLFCGTGVGISIAANRMRGIRAAVCSDIYSAKYTRLHNDANVLCLGNWVVGAGLAVELIEIFLNTPFEGGRHQRRVDLITGLEG